MLLMAYKLVCWLRLLLTAYAYVEGLYCGACRPRLYCGVLRCIAACCVLICVFGAGVAAMYCSLLRLYLRGRHCLCVCIILLISRVRRCLSAWPPRIRAQRSDSAYAARLTMRMLLGLAYSSLLHSVCARVCVFA